MSENEHKFNASNNCGGGGKLGLKPCLYIDFSERFNCGWKNDNTNRQPAQKSIKRKQIQSSATRTSKEIEVGSGV